MFLEETPICTRWLCDDVDRDREHQIHWSFFFFLMFSDYNWFIRHNRIRQVSVTTRGAKCNFLFGYCYFGSFFGHFRWFRVFVIIWFSCGLLFGFFYLFLGIFNATVGGCVMTSSPEGVVFASTTDATSVTLEELLDI